MSSFEKITISEKKEQSEQPHPKMKELSVYIKEFCVNTILGSESGFFKTFGKFAKEPQATFILSEYIAKYHNMAYKALILETDKYFLEEYGRMHEISGHSYICLLNITLNICAIIEQSIDREKLCIENYEQYMDSIKSQVEVITGKMNLDKFLSHKCTGIDIKSCNPDEDFVVLRFNKDNTHKEESDNLDAESNTNSDSTSISSLDSDN